MEINIFDERKTVEIWLTRAEKNDAALQVDLRPVFQQYKQQGYLVAVFSSGPQNLTEITSALLCYNRKHLAELQTEHEKKRSLESARINFGLANIAKAE